MKNRGIVKEVNGKKVTVLPFKSSGCEGCSHCSNGERFAGAVELETDLELKPNDLVNIEMNESAVIGLGFIVYMFPVFAFFVGYFIASKFSDIQGIKIIGSFIGLFIAFLFIVFYNRVKGKEKIKSMKITID